MTRPLRLEFPGATYHLTARANGRSRLFLGGSDRSLLLGLVDHVVDRYGWICHAYILMDTHYHLLVETPLPNLSLGMRQLNGRYSQEFNRRHRRRGHLFGGRFTSVLVERDEHFLEAARYVVLNPLRTRQPQRFQDWRWSSYPATAGIAPRPRFLTTDELLGRFSPNRPAAQRRYIGYIADGVPAGQPPELIGEIYLASVDFVAAIAPNEPVAEVPRRQWQPLRPSLAELCTRDHGIHVAHRTYGYTLGEIAAHLGLHPATVGRALSRLEAPAPLDSVRAPTSGLFERKT